MDVNSVWLKVVLVNEQLVYRTWFIHDVWIRTWVLVIYIVDLSRNKEKNFVFELVSSACIYSWIEKTQLLDKKIRNAKLVALTPFFVNFNEYLDCLHVSYKGHKLIPNTRVEKNAGYFRGKIDEIVDNVGLLFNRDKVEMVALVYKNPFVMLGAKTIHNIDQRIIMPDIHILKDLSAHPNKVYFIFAQAYHHSVLLFLSIQYWYKKKTYILLSPIPLNEVSLVSDGAIFFQRKYDDLGVRALRNFSFYICTKYVEIISKGHYLECLSEGDFSFAHNLHCDFVVEINKIIFFLYCISVVVRIDENQFNVFKNNVGLCFYLDDLFFWGLHFICAILS